MTELKKINDPQRRLGPFALLIDQLLGPSPAPTAFNPPVDLIEHENNYEIQVFIPGAKKEDFSIELEKNRLIISGSRKFEEKSEGKIWHRIETQYGSFVRTFNLPEHILAEQIEAKYSDGVLHIVVPKNEQIMKYSRIEIK